MRNMWRVAMAVALLWGMTVMAGDTTRAVSPSVAEIKAAAAKLVPLCQKMGKPQLGDWLVSHPESGQTFDEYLALRPRRVTDVYTTLYVQPLGDFSKTQEKLIDDTAEFLGIFYGVPVKKLKALPKSAVPETARRKHPKWGDEQILTGFVEDLLRKDRPKDAMAVIALTTSDLYPGEGWNFVFGEASLVGRVGVWSMYRFGDPEKEYTTVLQRTLKVASHETGHMLGIAHCTAYECGMNGSNSMPEADRQPMAFCRECDAKVWYACKSDIAGRYKKLAAWAGEHKLEAEAKFWREAESAVKK